MMMQRQTNGEENMIMDGLRRNWFIIIFIGTLVVGWTGAQVRMESLEKEVAAQKIELKEHEQSIQTIQTDFGNAIVEIKANYLFIKDKLTSLENKQ